MYLHKITSYKLHNIRGSEHLNVIKYCNWFSTKFQIKICIKYLKVVHTPKILFLLYIKEILYFFFCSLLTSKSWFGLKHRVKCLKSSIRYRFGKNILWKIFRSIKIIYNMTIELKRKKKVTKTILNEENVSEIIKKEYRD